jgi:hypothetical protein
MGWLYYLIKTDNVFILDPRKSGGEVHMEEKKVFGYPAFDKTGEMILATYDNAYRDMLMDIRVYRMRAGEKRSFRRDGEECALLLQSEAVPKLKF